jgi:hypothetical protein
MSSESASAFASVCGISAYRKMKRMAGRQICIDHTLTRTPTHRSRDRVARWLDSAVRFQLLYPDTLHVLHVFHVLAYAACSFLHLVCQATVRPYEAR